MIPVYCYGFWQNVTPIGLGEDIHYHISVLGIDDILTVSLPNIWNQLSNNKTSSMQVEGNSKLDTLYSFLSQLFPSTIVIKAYYFVDKKVMCLVLNKFNYDSGEFQNSFCMYPMNSNALRDDLFREKEQWEQHKLRPNYTLKIL